MVVSAVKSTGEYKMMKGIIIICAASLLLLVSCSKEDGKEEAKEDPGKLIRVTFTVGDVKIVSDSVEKNAATGDRILEKDILKTGENSYAVIQAGADSVVRVQENSEFRPDKVSVNDKSFYLLKGEIFCKLNKLSKSQEFVICSPTIAASVRGTQFNLSYRDKKNSVSVSEGNVAVIPFDEKKDFSKAMIVEPGYTAYIKEEKGKPSTIEKRKSSKEESEMLKNYSDTPIIPDVIKKTPDEIKNIMDVSFSTGNPDKDLKKKEIIKKQSASLKEIKDAFERIDEITLYNKQVITGIILTHDENYVVITPSGKKTIPRSNIKNVKVIK